MSNPIKYSTGSESLALKKGNFYIGTGDVGKGPSDTTGYYQGPSPVSGGYVIYMNKDGAPGNLSYHSAPTDAELIAFTNNLAGQSYTTASECFQYYITQSDKLIMNYDIPGWCTDGLEILLDGLWVASYPKTGNNWYDPSKGLTFIVDNDNPTYVNSSPFYWDFENSSNRGDNFKSSTSTSTFNQTQYTRCAWFNPESFTNFRTFMGIVQNQYGNNGDMALSITTDLTSYYVGLHQYARTVDFNTTRDIQLTGTTPLSTNTWYFGCVSYDRTNETAKIYLNGVLESTYTGIKWGNAQSDIMMIGGPDNDDYSGGRMFDGKIAWAAHYNKILSAEQIQSTFNNMKGRFGL